MVEWPIHIFRSCVQFAKQINAPPRKAVTARLHRKSWWRVILLEPVHIFWQCCVAAPAGLSLVVYCDNSVSRLAAGVEALSSQID